MNSGNSVVTALYFLAEGCPSCTGRALPQAESVRALFRAEDVHVRTVYAGEDPDLLRQYSIQGTPSLVLLDQTGRLRRRFTGTPPDLQLGAELMALVCEVRQPMPSVRPQGNEQ